MSISSLSNLSETLLTPLYARALEGQRKNPHFRDPYAEKIIKTLAPRYQAHQKSKMNRWGCAARTILIDRRVQAYLKKFPQATVINLGAGLDARYYRVDTGQLQWVNIDLAEVMALRAHFFPEEERVQNISASVFARDWKAQLATSEPVLIIAEGLLMYFTEAQIRTLFQEIHFYFPQATLVLELMSASFLKMQKLHANVKLNQITFKWGLHQAADFSKLCPFFAVQSEDNLTPMMRAYAPFFIILISPFLRSRNNFIGCFKSLPGKASEKEGIAT